MELNRVRIGEQAGRMLWQAVGRSPEVFRRVAVTNSECFVESWAGCHDSDFRGTRFKGTGLRVGRFRGCDLRRTDWRGVDMEETDLSGARLSGRGLFGDSKARTVSVKNADEAIFDRGSAIDRIASWAILRGLGNMPLLGVSNSALVFIFAWGATVAAARRAARRSEPSEPDQHVRWVLDLIEPIGHSLDLAYLMVALILVSIASTIFRFAAPDIVQDYTEARWTRELGHALVEYRAASFSGPWWRWACAVLYAVGLTYIVPYYGLSRAWVAFHALAS